MSKFRVDYEDNVVVPKGQYEVVITKAEPTTFGTGTDGVRVELTIREDIDQRMQGRKLYDKLFWTEKAFYKPMLIAKALGIPKGIKLGREDFAALILQMPVNANVVLKENDYGEAESIVNYYRAGKELEPSIFSQENTASNEELPEKPIQKAEEKRQFETNCKPIDAEDQRHKVINHCQVKYMELQELYLSELWELILDEGSVGSM